MNFPARQLTGQGIISDIIIFYFAAAPNGGFPTSGGECTQLHSSLSRRIKNPPTGGFKKSQHGRTRTYRIFHDPSNFRRSPFSIRQFNVSERIFHMVLQNQLTSRQDSRVAAAVIREVHGKRSKVANYHIANPVFFGLEVCRTLNFPP